MMSSALGGRGNIGPHRVFTRFLRDSGHTPAAARAILKEMGCSRQISSRLVLEEYRLAPGALPPAGGHAPGAPPPAGGCVWFVTMASLQLDGMVPWHLVPAAPPPAEPAAAPVAAVAPAAAPEAPPPQDVAAPVAIGPMYGPIRARTSQTIVSWDIDGPRSAGVVPPRVGIGRYNPWSASEHGELWHSQYAMSRNAVLNAQGMLEVEDDV